MAQIPWANGQSMDGAKPWNNHFQGWGINRLSLAMSIGSTFATAGNTTMQFLNDVQNQSPNTFENLGYGIGATASEATFTGIAGFFAWDMWRTRSGTNANPAVHAVKYKDEFFTSGKRYDVLSRSKNATKGLIRGNKFIKSGSLKRDILALTIAPIAIGIATSAGLGMAGSFIDNAIAEKKQRDMLNYDDRFFDTRRYDQSTYNQVSAAMQNYNDKMLSVARIYHSR